MSAKNFLVFCLAASANLVAAEDLALIDLRSGARRQLADFAPRLTVVNLWRSDCPPCVRELGWLAEEMRGRPEIGFIGIAIEEHETAQTFLAQHPIDLPLFTAASTYAPLSHFGDRVGAIPFTAILGPDRRVCRSRLGELTPDALAGDLAACAAKPKSASASRQARYRN